MTNKSGDDLNLKENPGKVENHYKKSALKKTIKHFIIDLNELTGLANFKEISKNPLQIPEYGQPDAPVLKSKTPLKTEAD